MTTMPHAAPRSASFQRTVHGLRVRAMYQLHRSRLMQIGVLALFWLIGETVARGIGLPLPGGIVGMAVVLALLGCGVIRPASVSRGASFLLAEMLLFFIPAVLAVIEHREFLGLLGLKVFGVVFLGTVLVMTGTALTVDLGLRLMAWSERRGEGCNA